MREFSRTQRLNKQIKRLVAQLIQKELQDPRLGMVTVSAVEVSRDLEHARVYITVLNDHENIITILAQLNHASGYLRHLLSKILTVRKIPALRFLYDPSIERGSDLSSLIDKAVADDKCHGHGSSR